jgi:hypothetical protein
VIIICKGKVMPPYGLNVEARGENKKQKKDGLPAHRNALSFIASISFFFCS